MDSKKKSFYIPKKQLIAMVVNLQNKEPDAETVIFNAFRDKIYGHLVKRARDIEIADELLSKVFMEIFDSVHQLREPAAFVAWTNRIVENQVAEYFRDYRREIELEEKLIEEQRLAATLKAEEIIVSQYLQKLPPKQARVLRLHLVDQYLIKDIAVMEGIPVGTVKSRLYYGRKALKELMIEEAND